jgi:Zn-dependent protease with chaperone function
MVYYNCESLENFEPLARALLFDIHNPWALIYELSSTHPLTGKRIRRLCKLSERPLFDFDLLESKYRIDKGKLYKNFLKDLAILLLPSLAMVCYFPVTLFLIYSAILPLSLSILLGGFFIVLGTFILIVTFYKYPSRPAQQSSVLELMGDVYASPIRGRSVELKGSIVGRGIPGYIFSEDMLFKDSTGLIYINYESWFPLMGNLLFALRKVEKLVGKEATVKGWFIRGLSQQVVVDRLEVEDEKIRGFSKWGGIFGGLFFITIGILIVLMVGI